MKKKYIIVVVLILLIAVTIPKIIDKANSMNAGETQEVKPVPVEVTKVQVGTLKSYAELLGTVSSTSQVNILPTVPAKVTSLNVAVGDSVKKGDVLFYLDKRDIEAQVDQAKVGLTTAAAAVDQAKIGLSNSAEAAKQATTSYEMAKANYEMNLANYENAVANLEKYEVLYAQGVISESEYEQMKLQASPSSLTMLEKQLEQAEQGLAQANLGIENAKIAVKQAEAGYSQAQIGYNSAMNALEDMTYTTPIDGIVSSINITENEFASNAQPAIVIDNLNEITIDFNVTEDLITKLAVDQDAEVIIPSLEDKVVMGKIKTISPVANARSLLYPITVTISNSDNTILPGMFVEIKLVKKELQDILYVPSNAVIIESGNYYVYTVKDDTHVDKKLISIGLDTGDTIQVVEGLTENDILVTKGLGFIDEDTIIEVVRGEQ